MASTCALQGALEEGGCAVGVNVGEERFEIVANAREVGFDGLWVDMGTLESDVVTQGLRGWVNRQCVKFTEREVGVCGRGIGVCGGGVDGHSEKDGALVDEPLGGPGQLRGLPGRWGNGGHFLQPPSHPEGVGRFECLNEVPNAMLQHSETWTGDLR